MRPPGRTTRAELGEELLERDHVAQREPARHPVRPRRRRAAAAGCRPRRAARPVRAFTSMPWEKSKPDRPVAPAFELAAEVAGAARQVDDERAARQPQLAHRAAPPADVHAERHHAVHQVVARRDRVEQTRGPRAASPRPAAAAAVTAPAPTSLDVVLGGLEQHPAEVVRDQRRHGGQQLAEGLDHLLGGAVVVAGRVADGLAHVLVEQVDGALGEPAHARRRRRARAPAGRRAEARTRAAAAPCGRARCRPPCSGARRRPRVPEPDALALHRLDQRRRHAARLRERLEAERARRTRRPRREPRLPRRRGPRRRARARPHHPADRRERQPLALQRPDLAGSARRARGRTRPRALRVRAAGSSPRDW